MDYSDVLRQECAKEFRLPKPVSEDNWKSRMDFCNKMTAAVDTYGADRLPKDFTLQIEPFFNNILECAVSERTQLSNAACKLLGALPKILGRDIHPHLDRMLPILLKLCANTKQVTVKMAAASVANIVQYATYNPRLLWHICQVFEDKASGPKQHATTWLQTIMNDDHRSITSHKDMEMISRALSLALEDADASVRTSSRATYWTFSKIDKDSAAEIMDKLNNHARTALQNDPHNPDKKAGPSKPAPPRPKSALADVRKEQARKKKAEEEAQKQRKGFATSTTSHDGTIEIHEPAKPRVKPTKEGIRPETTPAAQPALDDRRHKDWDRVKADSKKTHKKALSQDDELVTKPSTNSRLLSAPVRRPRINITPINPDLEALLPQNTRPASRSEHNGQIVQPREARKVDSRPTSSSSSKSAPTAPASAANNLRTNIGAPPYIPDGKENAVAFPIIPKKTRPLPVPGTSPEKLKEDNLKQNRGVQPPPDKTLVEHQTSPEELQQEAQYDQRKLRGHRVLLSNDKPLPQHEVPPPRSNQAGYIDIGSARKYLNYGMRDLWGTMNDPIRCKKLKSAIEQHSDLITEQSVWTELLHELLGLMIDKDELSPESWVNEDYPVNLRIQPYIRQLILQMTVPLMLNYPQWAMYEYAFWIYCMTLYRCTLPTDPRDRRSEMCMKNIDKIITHSKLPLAFIISVLKAVEHGEEVILDGFETKKKVAVKKRAEKGIPSMIEPDSIKLEEGRIKKWYGRQWYEPYMYTDDFTEHYDPYDERSRLLYLGEIDYAGNVPDKDDIDYEAKMTAAADRMKLYVRRAQNLTTESDHQVLPYPKTLPLLYDTALQALERILSEAYGRSKEQGNGKKNVLSHKLVDPLCELARKCLESYDYMIKRSVIPFVKALYISTEDKDQFFGHFKEEGTRNLLEYYLFESTR